MRLVNQNNQTTREYELGDTEVIKEFKRHFIKAGHPWKKESKPVGLHDVTFRTYDALGSQKTEIELLADLEDFIKFCKNYENDCATFIATFPKRKYYTETQFEKLLWKQLRYLHLVDMKPWKHSATHELTDDKFLFSLAGQPFYVMGTHPGSETKAQRSPYPALIFNLTEDFAKSAKEKSNKKTHTELKDYYLIHEDPMGSDPMSQGYALEIEARQYGKRELPRVLRNSKKI